MSLRRGKFEKCRLYSYVANIKPETKKTAVLRPARFQPLRSAKSNSMAHQQVLQQEQQRREEAERQLSSLSTTLEELRQQMQVIQSERVAEREQLA